MPITARIVAPDSPHHITQRGPDRQKVFFSVRNHRVYLDLLRENAAGAEVRILAYYLMGNHSTSHLRHWKCVGTDQAVPLEVPLEVRAGDEVNAAPAPNDFGWP